MDVVGAGSNRGSRRSSALVSEGEEGGEVTGGAAACASVPGSDLSSPSMAPSGTGGLAEGSMNVLGLMGGIYACARASRLELRRLMESSVLVG